MPDDHKKIPNEIPLSIEEVRELVLRAIDSNHLTLRAIFNLVARANCEPPTMCEDPGGGGGSGGKTAGAKYLKPDYPTPKTDAFVQDYMDGTDSETRPTLLIDVLRALEKFQDFVEEYYVSSAGEPIE